MTEGLFKHIHYAIELSSDVKKFDLKLLARHNPPSYREYHDGTDPEPWRVGSNIDGYSYSARGTETAVFRYVVFAMSANH